MLLIRRFEEKAAQMYGLRKIGGFCHLYIGQEAVAVGSCRPRPGPRLRGDRLPRPRARTRVRHETEAAHGGAAGKATGCSKGKGGSMHFFDAARHFLGGNGIVGAQIHHRGRPRVPQRGDGGVVACFGDGAIHQGSFHESLNMARIWNLPVVYICENNQYGMGTDFRRVSSVTDFAALAAAYGIPGKQVNGMDVLEVHGRSRRRWGGCVRPRCPSSSRSTYRYRGHSMSDPAKYRTPEELESYKAQDPIVVLTGALKSKGELTPTAYDALDAKAACDDAVRFAEESPEPEASALYEDVLA